MAHYEGETLKERTARGPLASELANVPVVEAEGCTDVG